MPDASSRTLLIATSNPGKLREMRAMIPDDVAVVSLTDAGITLPSETGSTFREIAEQKALFAARASGLLSLADDSGLEVDALGGKPGVRSARYAGEPPDDARNRQVLLARLRDLPQSERGARFVSAVTIASPDGHVWTSEGELRGTIFDRERGTGGFGYDSVFLLPDGRTVAELLDEEKNTMSHRAEAMARIVPTLPAAFAAHDAALKAKR
jgi:XTP/dITP diphosphohydrolase